MSSSISFPLTDSAEHHASPVSTQQIDPFVLAEITKDQSTIASAAELRVKGFTLLDEAYDEIKRGEIFRGMHRVGDGLNALRSQVPYALWRNFAEVECLQHPLRHIVHQDPFTRRSFDKPRGYAGDAYLIDFIYGDALPPANTTELGAAIFQLTTDGPAAKSTRARRDMLATIIDEVATVVRQPRLLSIACGHLREAERSQAVQQGNIGEYLGMDQDAESVAFVNSAQAHLGLRATVGSVRGILSRKVKFNDFDFVYAAGLYDYLNVQTATRLTTLLFGMLNQGGRLLVANHLPYSPDVGYMQSYMGWNLIYRSKEQLVALTNEINSDEVQHTKMFVEPHGHIAFLEVIKN